MSDQPKPKRRARRQDASAPAFPMLPLVGGDVSYRQVSGSSIRPNVTAGVGFGDAISDADRHYASTREPIAFRVIYPVAFDVFKNWFEINDLDTKKPDAELNAKIQQALENMNAKQVLTNALAYERLYGTSYLILAYNDAIDEKGLSKPVSDAAELTGMAAYPKTAVKIASKDEDINSPNFAKPIAYEIDRGNGKKSIVHASRVIKIQTRIDGRSVLDPIWDDLTCLRNIRWGMAQTIYRYGSGFPVITVKGASYAKLKEYAQDENISDLMSRTCFLGSDSVSLDFKGAQGAAINPAPYYTAIMENISAGCGIPLAVLRGAQAGALTGSEVNEREYASVISGIQSMVEPFVKEIISRVMKSLGIEGIRYEIRWNSPIATSPASEADILLKKEQAMEKRLNYMTVNEVRELNGLEPIEGGDELKAKIPAIGGFDSVSVGKMIPAESAHPALVAGLKAIVMRAVNFELTEESAVELARSLIAKYVDEEIDRAKAYLSARLKRNIAILPPEMAELYKSLMDSYLKDFRQILKDALASRGRNPKPAPAPERKG